MSARPFRWGILGPGRIAHRFAQDLQVVEGATLQAVASRSAARARDFADLYGATAAYDSDEALAADPAVDAVYIATPHRFHFDQTRLCLEAGKPVLCEKPFTVNAAQARALIPLAQAKGLFMMEALWSRFLPVYRQVRAWLDEGEIGEIKLVVSTFCFQPERDPSDRKFNPDLCTEWRHFRSGFKADPSAKYRPRDDNLVAGSRDHGLWHLTSQTSFGREGGEDRRCEVMARVRMPRLE